MSSAVTAAVGSAVAGAGVSHLLGGSGSGSGGQVTQTSGFTPDQLALLKQIGDQVSGQIGQGAEAYPGQEAAGPSDIQNSLFSLMGSAPDLAGWANGQLTSNKTYDPTAARDYWNQSFVQPAEQNFNENTLPALMEQFAGQGALSSGGFNRAVTKAAGDMNTQLGGQLGNILYQDKNTFNNDQYRNKTLGLSTLDNVLNQMRSAGGTQQGIAQNQLNEGYNKWNQSQPYNNPWLGYLGQAMTSPYQAQNYQTPGQPSFMNQLASPLGNIFGGVAQKGISSLFNLL